MILKFDLKSHAGCPVIVSFLKNPTNVASKGYKPQQMLSKKQLSLFGVTMRKDATCGGEL